MKNEKTTAVRSKLAAKGGGYSLLITAIVLALLIAANVFISLMPTTWTKHDISSAQLYSVTSNTKAIVNNLSQDVTIYWIVQSDTEDTIIENLLDTYASLSDRISVVKKNPDIFPTFAAQYTDETVSNNSLVIESGERSRYIAYEDIYPSQTNMSTYTMTTSFDGEGAISSGIDYVVTEDLPKLYIIGGHGEASLPSGFSEQITKENYEVSTLTLSKVDEIPEDADCLIIYAPSSDISEQEAEMLSDYVGSGGRLFVSAGPLEDENLDNLYSIIDVYGLDPVEGIVVESDRNYYAYGTPHILMPTMNSDSITGSLMQENYYALVPVAQGITVRDVDSRGAVLELLSSSETAYSKAAGYSLSTYEKEDGDIDGPFSLGLLIDDYGGGKIVWYSSSAMFDDVYNAYSSGANLDLAMNSLSELVGEREAIAIRSKSLNYSYLTISDTTSSMLKTLMIGVFPVCYLAIGIIVIIRKRRLQNEAA